MAAPTLTQQIETILQGNTAQNKGGTGQSVQNSSSVAAAGNPRPGDLTPGYYAAGMPEGNPSFDIVPGSDVSGDTFLPAPGTATATTGGTVLAGTYKVAVTYVYPWGESSASAQASQVTTGSTSTITITSPAAAAGATAWYAYVSQVNGTSLTRQQAAGSPTAIGTNLTLTAPPSSTGAAAPLGGGFANILTVSAPAGTAGGGGIYPQTPSNPVPNPFTKLGWTVQNTAEIFIEFSYTPASFAHTVGGTVTPVLQLSQGSDTFVVTVKEVNGVLTSTLPTGYSIAASTGVITVSTSGAIGVTTIGLTVTDNAGRQAEADVVVTLT